MKLPDLSVIKKITAIGFGNVLGQVIGLLFLTILARWMEKGDYGEVRYIISIATVAATIIAAGLPTTLTRFLAKYKDDEKKTIQYFTNIVLLFGIMLVLTELAVFIIFWPNYIYLLVVFGYSLPFFYFGLLRGRMHYYKISIASILQNLVKFIILIVVFYSIGISNVNVLLIYSFGGWIALLVIEMISTSFVKIDLKLISKDYLKKIIKFSIPVMITTYAFSLMTYLPIIVLERFWDFETVAIFSTAFLIMVVFSFIPIAITTITMPKMANVKSIIEKISIFERSVIIISITGILLLILVAIVGKWGLVLIFTDKYESSYWPMILISIGSIFYGIKNAFSALWEAGGRPIISTYDSVIGMILTLIICLVFVPVYGNIGAAFGFMIGWAGSVIVSSVFLARLISNKFKLL